MVEAKWKNLSKCIQTWHLTFFTVCSTLAETKASSNMQVAVPPQEKN